MKNTIVRVNDNSIHYQVIDDEEPNKKEWSEQDHEEFVKLCAPLVEFIQQRHDKCNPYSWIIIQWNGVAFMPDSHWYPFKVPDDGVIEQMIWQNTQTGEIKSWAEKSGQCDKDNPDTAV